MTDENMDAKVDEVKGHIKEGVGKIFGDKELETEGAVEKLGAKAKELVEDAGDMLEGAKEDLKNVFGKDEDEGE